MTKTNQQRRHKMYQHNSELAEKVCEKVGFRFDIHPLKTMQRNGKIYVKGTALKPDEALDLESECRANGYIYRGPFAR